MKRALTTILLILASIYSSVITPRWHEGGYTGTFAPYLRDRDNGNPYAGFIMQCGAQTIQCVTHIATQFCAQALLFKGMTQFCDVLKSKALTFAKNNPLVSPEVYLQTPDGVVLNCSLIDNVPSSSVKECLTKFRIRNIINRGYEAILKNGYYELNGLKFSKYYYERLWDKGRKSPSLIAKSILKYYKKKSKIADDKPGFFRYETSDWEMIYNPTTKEVWHLQQI